MIEQGQPIPHDLAFQILERADALDWTTFASEVSALPSRESDLRTLVKSFQMAARRQTPVVLTLEEFVEHSAKTWSPSTFDSRLSEFNGLMKVICAATKVLPNDARHLRVTAKKIDPSATNPAYQLVWIGKHRGNTKGVAAARMPSSLALDDGETPEKPSVAPPNAPQTEDALEQSDAPSGLSRRGRPRWMLAAGGVVLIAIFASLFAVMTSTRSREASDAPRLVGDPSPPASDGPQSEGSSTKDNLLKNGDFEEDLQTHWRLPTRNYVYREIDRSTDNHYLRLSNDRDSRDVVVSQRIILNPEWRRFRVRFDMRTIGLTTDVTEESRPQKRGIGARLTVKFYAELPHEGGARMRENIGERISDIPQRDGRWETMDYVVDAPAGQPKVMEIVPELLGRAGQADFDNITVTVVK